MYLIIDMDSSYFDGYYQDKLNAIEQMEFLQSEFDHGQFIVVSVERGEFEIIGKASDRLNYLYLLY